MNAAILEQCTIGAFDGSVPFPQTIARLSADGVEWYSANLIFGMTTYYAAGLSRHSSSWPDWKPAEIAGAFSAGKVSVAIKDSQAGRISYRVFLERIADAGVTYYTVHLKGRKAIYFGRHGDSFVEPFPGS